MKHSFLFLFAIVLISCHDHPHNLSEHYSHDDLSHNHDLTIDYFGSYTIEDKNYGTKTVVKIIGYKRVMTTNSLPNHKTGDFPNQGNPNKISEQDIVYEFPLNPKYTGNATWAREPGVAINGIKFEPQTAEVVQCESGENYRIEAIQDLVDLGLDFNHAHVQPTGAYHYHGVPTSVVGESDADEDLIHIGFAHDGFPMYYSKSGKYKPSYKLQVGNREGEDCVYENPKETIDVSVGSHHDGTFGEDFEFIEAYGDLDECNGITINGQYMYLVTNEFPYVGRCLMGEFEGQNRPDMPPGGNGRPPQGRPSFSQLLDMMDSNKDGKLSKPETKGPLSEDFDRVDINKDGFIKEEELQIPPQGNREGRRPRRG